MGIGPETLRSWVTQAEIDDGAQPRTTSSDTERMGLPPVRLTPCL